MDEQTSKQGSGESGGGGGGGFVPMPSNVRGPQKRGYGNRNYNNQQQQRHQQHRWQGRGRGRGRRGGGGGGGRGRGRGGRGGRGRWRQPPPGAGEDTGNIEELGAESLSAGPCISIAVEGCCHGDLDSIYRRLQRHEETTGRKIDLLLCCGDFQSLRNAQDFHSLAVPPKYRTLGSFYRYYSGESVAPIKTIFIGGNHEASQPLHELRYGGWVAPNIYYLGAAGVVRYNGLRIGGISGIYKSHDYVKGSFERPPFDRSTMRSVYHVRNVDVYRLKCLKRDSDHQIDLMLSHDWPQGIEQHGDTNALLRMKPFFRDEVERNALGSPPNRELLDAIQPRWWFAAHLHVKFKATVEHGGGDSKPSALDLIPSQAIGSTDSSNSKPPTTTFIGAESSDPCAGPDLTAQMTRFLSLDKCLPRRQYLSIVHIPVRERLEGAKLEYDSEWLAILRKTHGLTKKTTDRVTVPPAVENVTSEEVEWIRQHVGPSFDIPESFERNVPPHTGPPSPLPRPLPPPLPMMGNPQTDRFLSYLQLSHITTIPFQKLIGEDVAANRDESANTFDENEICIDDEDDDDGEGTSIQDENEIDIDEDDDCDDGEGTNSAESKEEEKSTKKVRVDC